MAVFLALAVAGCNTPQSGEDRPPVPVVRMPPLYPLEAKRSGLTGDVTVEFVINTDGAVSEAHVVRSSNPVFDAAAVAAVYRWKFRPGIKGGQPVNTKIQQILYFSMTDDPPAKN
jgi:protein TonB